MRRLAVTLAAIALLAPSCERMPAQPPSLTGPSPLNQRSCAAELQVGQTQYDELGGQTPVTITATSSGCFWNLTYPDWMTVTPQPNGVGNRVLSLSVAPSRDTRDGTIELGDRTVRIHQAPKLLLSAHCAWGRAGQITFCTALMTWLSPPPAVSLVYPYTPTVDLRAFGLSQEWPTKWGFSGGYKDGLPYLSVVYDLDFPVPPAFPPGFVDITFKAVDVQGRVATATVPIEIRR